MFQTSNTSRIWSYLESGDLEIKDCNNNELYLSYHSDSINNDCSGDNVENCRLVNFSWLYMPIELRINMFHSLSDFNQTDDK